MPIRQRSESLRICMRALFDGCWMAAGFLFTVVLCRREEYPWLADIWGRAEYPAVFLAVWCAVVLDRRLLVSRRGETLVMALAKAARAILVSVVLSGFLLAVLLGSVLDRVFLVTGSASVLVANQLLTIIVRPGVWRVRRRGHNTRCILLVGASDRMAQLVDVLRSHEQYGFRIEGFLEDDAERRPILEASGVPFLGGIQQLEAVLTNRVVDAVYVSLPIRSDYETIGSIVHLCEGVGVPVRLLADLFPRHLVTCGVTRLGDIPLLSLRRPRLLSRLARRQPSGASSVRLRTKTEALIGIALADTIAILLAYGFAMVASLSDHAVMPYRNAPYLVVFLVVWYAVAMDRGLWSTRPSESLGSYLVAVLKGVGAAAILCVLLTALLAPEYLAHGFLMKLCIGTLVALPACRAALRRTLIALRRRGLFKEEVLIVGANERTAHLGETVRRFGLTVAGVLDDEPDRAAPLADSGLPYLGHVGLLDRVLAERRIEHVYVTLPMRSHYEVIQDLFHRCEDRRVPVHLVADLLPLHIASSDTMMVGDIPAFSLSPVCEDYGRLVLKRAIDLVGSTLLISALSPVFLVIAVLIKLDSKGPVFFKQVRVGQNQRQFRLIKFRSMVVGAEERRKDLDALNEADGPVFKIRNDPRITRAGKFIRKSSLDELPQLFNVWWGDMSLVGPRPPLPSEVEQYTWHQRRRLSVKPGMTGLWQVSGRSDVPFDKWVELDLAYIDSWSLTQDFLILLKTAKAVITGRGAA